jgi:hypothetical protein
MLRQPLITAVIAGVALIGSAGVSFAWHRYHWHSHRSWHSHHSSDNSTSKSQEPATEPRKASATVSAPPAPVSKPVIVPKALDETACAHSRYEFTATWQELARQSVSAEPAPWDNYAATALAAARIREHMALDTIARTCPDISNASPVDIARARDEVDQLIKDIEHALSHT